MQLDLLVDPEVRRLVRAWPTLSREARKNPRKLRIEWARLAVVRPIAVTLYGRAIRAAGLVRDDGTVPDEVSRVIAAAALLAGGKGKRR